MTPLAECFVTDFVALAETYARHNGDQGPMAVLIDLFRFDVDLPVGAYDQQRYGNFLAEGIAQVRGSRLVRRFVPWSARCR
jgi:hypothetical protein